MAKKLKPIEQEEKPISITSAVIKDEQCNYGYEIKTGPGAGDKIPNRKGSSIIHDDMTNAFIALAVHLAILDDGFKYLGKEGESLDNMESHEVTDLFRITGFKITGSDENEGVILQGEKFVAHGSISLESPKISRSSGYPYVDELFDSIALCREEVESYMNGKSAPRLEQQAMNFETAGVEDNAFDSPM